MLIMNLITTRNDKVMANNVGYSFLFKPINCTNSVCLRVIISYVLFDMSVKWRKQIPSSEKMPCTSKCSLKNSEIYHDLHEILILIFLYILQGIPLGLGAAVPFLLQSDAHTANYQYQAIFSWVLWPFSLKLAWAPIVDALYSSRLGRRKTWLVPIQYALGIDLFVLSSQVDEWLGRGAGQHWGPLGVAGGVRIWALTCAFFLLNMLAATQDIVVDGWALTMLSKENIGWASTCNSVGQTVGYMIGFFVFLALESPEVCNSYFRSTPVSGQGLVSFADFLYFCGILFILSTTLVAFFKSEVDEQNRDDKQRTGNLKRNEDNEEAVAERLVLLTKDGEDGEMVISHEVEIVEILNAEKADKKEMELSLWQTYAVMLQVFQLRPVLRYISFVFLVKFVFSASDSVFGLKLLENGVSKEKMALIGAMVVPIQAFLPIFITRWSNGPFPLSVYLNAFIPRAILAGLTVVIVHYAPYFRTPGAVEGTHAFSSVFYGIIIVECILYSICQYTMFVCQMSYHARVSDPTIGGTYMTLLNTAANMAGSLPSTLMLFLVDMLTSRSCDSVNMEKAVDLIRNTSETIVTPPLDKLKSAAVQYIVQNATCKSGAGREACLTVGGRCNTLVDGFYIEVGICLLVGLISFFTLLRPMAKSLDRLPLSAYRYSRSRKQPSATDNPVN